MGGGSGALKYREGGVPGSQAAHAEQGLIFGKRCTIIDNRCTCFICKQQPVLVFHQLCLDCVNGLLRIRHLHGKTQIIMLGEQPLVFHDEIFHGAESADQSTALMCSKISTQNRHEHIDATFGKAEWQLPSAAPT